MQIEDLNFLVAEDHAFQRRSLVRMLVTLGAKQIAEAADGHAALEAFQGNASPIDIGIIDLNMPGMDGLELIRHLAEENHLGSIILASALDRSLIASVETMSKAYGINLLGTIEKPATLDKLRALIDLHEAQLARPLYEQKVRPLFTPVELAAGLRQGQFDAVFQPKVEFASRRVAGAEALARWRHPQHGLIAPDAFIPLLEQHGLIDELTWIILEKAVAACCSWHAQGLAISVSINLSLLSLGEPRLVDDIIEHVSLQGIEPRFITFEVTESAAMADVPHCLENLARLRMKGFALSIDDYGTGYSSMQQLLRIPFSELKIDKSFVSGAAENETLKSILDSSLALSRRLHLSSVAEGIETEQDWNLLRDLGCDYAQGYFVSRPISGPAFPNWMNEWSRHCRNLLDEQPQ